MPHAAPLVSPHLHSLVDCAHPVLTRMLGYAVLGLRCPTIWLLQSVAFSSTSSFSPPEPLALVSIMPFNRVGGWVGLQECGQLTGWAAR